MAKIKRNNQKKETCRLLPKSLTANLAGLIIREAGSSKCQPGRDSRKKTEVATGRKRNAFLTGKVSPIAIDYYMENETDETVEEWMKDIRIPSPAELGLSESGIEASADTNSSKPVPYRQIRRIPRWYSPCPYRLKAREMTSCRLVRLFVKRRKPCRSRWPFPRKRPKKNRRQLRSRRGVI